MDSPLIVTRRSALLLVGSALGGVAPRLYASSGEFWNKKDPATWSSDEREKLLTKSPWAKEVGAQMAPAGGGYGSGSPGGGGYPGGGSPGGIGIPRGRIGIGGIGFPGGVGGRRGGGGGRGRAGASVKGTVRWESARPILDASRKTLGDDFDKHYVICIEGFPTVDGRRDSDDQDRSGSPPNRTLDDTMNDIKQDTILQPKGRALAQAGVIQRKGSTLLFGFSKETLDLSADDKEVEFHSRLPRLVVKAKFNFKEMLYHGKLAV